MNISDIAQDQQGYIWVATMGGLSRYNGYEFKRFYFDSGDPASLRSNHVHSLFCSADGLMYTVLPFVRTEKLMMLLLF
jgi:ligand-binding sensor domain-containing protein